MIESPDRVAEFKAEVADMRLADPAVSRDRLLLRLAFVLLVIGPLLGLGAYALSHGTTNPLQQRDAIVVALLGVSLTIVGGALYLRYSLARLPEVLAGSSDVRAEGPNRPPGSCRDRKRRASMTGSMNRSTLLGGP